MPKVSVVIPVYNMDNAQSLLERNLKSVYIQSFDDYEIVISDDSDDNALETWLKKLDMPIRYFRNPTGKGMAKNTNYALERAKGDLIKILFQDDYFYHSRSLYDMMKHFTPLAKWLVTACIHDSDGQLINPHYPHYSYSENSIGSPSVMMFHRTVQARFDPEYQWVLDLDLYRRLNKQYGKPKILNNINIVIGLHSGQVTNKLTVQEKQLEHQLLEAKYNYENGERKKAM